MVSEHPCRQLWRLLLSDCYVLVLSRTGTSPVCHSALKIKSKLKSVLIAPKERKKLGMECTREPLNTTTLARREYFIYSFNKYLFTAYQARHWKYSNEGNRDSFFMLELSSSLGMCESGRKEINR